MNPSMKPALIKDLSGVIAALLAFWAATLSGGPAAAATLGAPTMGLSLELRPPGALVCVIIPAAARDLAGCEGLDVAAIEAAVRSQAQVADQIAMVRFDDWGFMVSVLTQPGVRLVASEDIAEYVDGMVRGISQLGVPAAVHGSAPGTTHDVLRVNGAPVARTRLEISVPPGHALHETSRVVSYLFAGKDAMTTVSFTCAPANLSRMMPVAEAAIQTAAMPATAVDDFGKPRHYLQGKAIGGLIGMLVPVVGMLVVAVAALVIVLRKKKAA